MQKRENDLKKQNEECLAIVQEQKEQEVQKKQSELQRAREKLVTEIIENNSVEVELTGRERVQLLKERVKATIKPVMQTKVMIGLDEGLPALSATRSASTGSGK